MSFDHFPPPPLFYKWYDPEFLDSESSNLSRHELLAPPAIPDSAFFKFGQLEFPVLKPPGSLPVHLNPLFPSNLDPANVPSSLQSIASLCIPKVTFLHLLTKRFLVC